MKYKKKPRLFYIITIVVSLIGSIVIIYLHSNIKMLETSVFSGRMIRLLRDISRINFYMLFISCIPILIRGLGFDIKKFNFKSDLLDLNLNHEDSEEVEVNIDLGSDNVVRKGRKTIRELKYYYAENKLIINIILFIVIGIIILLFPFNRYVVNRSLKEGEIYGNKYIDIRVSDSYVSERYKTSKNNSYVIVKIDVKGKTDKYSLDLNKFVLKGKNNKYVPSMKYYHYFNDVGVGYRNNIIEKDKYSNYLLIYNIKNEDKNSGFELVLIDDNKMIELDLEVLD